MFRLAPHLYPLRIVVLVVFSVLLSFGYRREPRVLLAQESQNSQSEIKAPRRNPIMIGGNISEDPRQHIVYPVYPENAKRAHIEGIVRLTLTINEEGFVYAVAGTPGNSPILEKSAIDAVKQWRFRPYLLRGEPIPVLKRETVSFVWKDRNDVQVWFDESGLSCDIKQILDATGTVWINIGPGMPYRLVESLYRTLIQKGVQRVHWPNDYRIFQNQLFVSRGMIEKGGINFDNPDIERISQLALASGKLGKKTAHSISYVLYFDKAHVFVDLQRLEGPEIPGIETAIRRLRPNERIFLQDAPVAISFYLKTEDPR